MFFFQDFDFRLVDDKRIMRTHLQSDVNMEDIKNKDIHKNKHLTKKTDTHIKAQIQTHIKRKKNRHMHL